MAQAKTGSQKGVLVTRREFLSWTWWAIAGVLLLETGLGLSWSLWARRPKIRPGQFGSLLSAGNVNDYQIGDVRLIEKGKFFVSKVEENGYLALYRKCPHLGCPVPWDANEQSWDSLKDTGKFWCRCHGSQFDRYGVKHAGPAPRPMDTMKGEIDPQGNIIVDTGSIATRAAFDSGQFIKMV